MSAAGALPQDPAGRLLPEPPAARLLPAALGHAIRGTAAPPVPADAVEAFLERVAAAHRESRASGLEHGFLAYLPHEPGLPLVAEPDAVGSPHDIRWHWRERDAAVAFSFHTHPGRDALCIPSGMDMVGALVRGDHLIYVLTADGRLSGWRFRDPRGHPHAVQDAMRALEDAQSLRRPLVSFLYDAFDALRARILEPAYAARVTLRSPGGCSVEGAAADASFFSVEEARRGFGPA